MRAVVAAMIVGVVLTASLLNLFLGALWVIALGGIGLLRRQTRYAAPLTVLGSLGAGALLAQVGALAPPAPATYAASEWTRLAERWGVWTQWLQSQRPEPVRAVEEGVRAKLGARRHEELRYTPAEFTRRAAATIEASRTLAGLRDRAPAEVAAVEQAVARLAVTLTHPEFRDLAARWERLLGHFAALEGRLRAARDPAELEAIGRALEPAAMASVAFAPIMQALQRVDAAMARLTDHVGGAAVSVTGTSRLRYDEARERMVLERQYVLTAEAPLRIVGVTLAGFGGPTPGGPLGRRFLYGTGHREPRDRVPDGGIVVRDGTRRLVLVDHSGWTATSAPLRSPLKPVAFRRVGLEDRTGSIPEFLAHVRLEPRQEPRVLLDLGVPAVSLDAVLVPSYALHYANRPGTVRMGVRQDAWIPRSAHGSASGLMLEFVPRTWVLRNPVFARVRPYLYQPNPAAIVTLAGLAGLTAALLEGGRRNERRPTPPRG